jgi:sugar/nucleoside kinase (ribokinase family)
MLSIQRFRIFGILYSLEKPSFQKQFDFKGAGDAFVGSFAHYLSRLGIDKIEQVLRMANEYASLTVQKKGTQTSYPHIDDLDEKFRNV